MNKHSNYTLVVDGKVVSVADQSGHADMHFLLHDGREERYLM